MYYNTYVLIYKPATITHINDAFLPPICIIITLLYPD